MDIDELVRRGRPDSAGWAQGDAGRRVLEGVVAAGEPPTRRAVRVAGRPVLRWSFLGTGLVGAATAAVLAVAALSAPQDAPADTPPVAGGQPGAADSARDVLLAAATRAERAPVETGKYWHVKTLDVYGPKRVGTEPAGYWVLGRSVNESWDAGDPRDASWTGYREIGVRPRGEADERAWRAAGSPTQWTLDADGSKLVLSTLPGKGDLYKEPEAPRYLTSLWDLSLEQVRQLPDEPDALRALLTSRVQARLDEEGATADATRINLWVFSVLGQLLSDTPAPPKVRAAAYRILADIPEVRSLGTVQDQSGRSGQGVEFSGAGSIERLIIDPSTHRLLGSNYASTAPGEKVPTKEGSTVVLIAEWSDAAPQVPTLPQE